VGRARYVVAMLLALSLWGAPQPLGGDRSAKASPLRMVAADGVTAYVPSGWEVRPIQWAGSQLRGIQASGNLERWSDGSGRGQGIRAYWVDATTVRLPSDYYVLAAKGPAMQGLPSSDRCRSDGSTVLLGGGRKPHDLPRGYLATASGTCRTEQGKTRWAAFVAAPGFGPLREMGIPQSGMYFAMASVEDGPQAEEVLNRILTQVSFGTTEISEFLSVVEAPGHLL
jgi:hypothetical protein